jgi:dTDP-4-amino-4,6-dideoxygalactose transaminase
VLDVDNKCFGIFHYPYTGLMYQDYTLIRNTRAIQKVASCELLTKQAMRTKISLYTKNTYLKQIKNISSQTQISRHSSIPPPITLKNKKKELKNEMENNGKREKISHFSTWSLPELRHLYWGISFCMPVSEKSAACELSLILTPSISYSLLLKCCDPNQFFRYINKW